MKQIKLGTCGDADCTLLLEDKEYLIETRAWNLIDLLSEGRISQLLDYIYENFDEDLAK